MEDLIVVGKVCALIRMFSNGKTLKHEKYPYPIAMGEDYSLGFLYNNDRVVGDMTVKQLFEIAKEIGIVIPD